MHDATDKPDPKALQSRLLALWERTNDEALHRLAGGRRPFAAGKPASEQEHSDWISTCLMTSFKSTGDAEVFALLFELNRGAFLQAIRYQLRRSSGCVDPEDVLQEVFLNIYRYPNHFHADKPNAFRSWGHRIVRNATLKFVKVQARQPSPLLLDEDDELPQDTRAQEPENVLAAHESSDLVNQAYVLYLCLYLAHFERLSKRERKALTMAEIQGRCYADIAAAIGIKFENVRMVIFRSRQRILRGLSESLATLGHVPGAAPAVASVLHHGTRRGRPRSRRSPPAKERHGVGAETHHCCARPAEQAWRQATAGIELPSA